MFKRRETQNTSLDVAVMQRLSLVRSDPSQGDSISRKSGFTLVELIVSLMLAAIVIGAAGSLLIFGSNLFSHTAERSQQQVDTTSVASTISEELRLSPSVRVVRSEEKPTNTSIPSGFSALYVGDASGDIAHEGYLYMMIGGVDSSPRNYFGSSFYGNYTISLDYRTTVVSGEPKYFELSVSTHDSRSGADTGTSTSKTFQLINSRPASQPYASGQVNSVDTKFYILYKN